MIPSPQPFRPVQPTMEDIISGRTGSVGTYVQNLYRYVSWTLLLFLYDDEIVKLRGPLYVSRCPAVDNTPKNAASGAWRPTSIMEPLDMKNCISALSHSNFYEGTISIWNLDPLKTRAFETDLDLKDPTWLQFNVLAGHWSKDHLASSHSDKGQQRYFVSGNHAFLCQRHYLSSSKTSPWTDSL